MNVMRRFIELNLQNAFQLIDNNTAILESQYEVFETKHWLKSIKTIGINTISFFFKTIKKLKCSLYWNCDAEVGFSKRLTQVVRFNNLKFNVYKYKKPVIRRGGDWLFLVDRNIELSNLDALFDRSRQSLIWE